MANTLADPKLQDVLKAWPRCPDLKSSIARLRQLSPDTFKVSDLASKVQQWVPKDKGPRDYPFLKHFIQFAHDTYQAADGPGKGSNEIPKEKRVNTETVLVGPH